MGTAQQGSGAAALGLTITNNGDDFIDLSGIGGEEFPTSSGSGQIDFSATASGGDGSYSYAWSIVEQGDDNNINTGNIRVGDAGTTNQAQYNDAIVTGYDTGLSAASPPVEARLQVTCTVTDGTGATANESVRIMVVLQVFE